MTICIAEGVFAAVNEGFPMMQPETFTRFDAADYLKTEQDVAAYMEAAAEDGDADAMVAALATVARARNMSQLARDAGVTREGLYKALAPGGSPGFGTVAKVAGALGYSLAFVPKNTVQAVALRGLDAPEADVVTAASARLYRMEGAYQGAIEMQAAGRTAGRGMTKPRGAVSGLFAMATGKKAASAASKELKSKTSTAGKKTVAGSDLAQAKAGSKKGGKKA